VNKCAGHLFTGPVLSLPDPSGQAIVRAIENRLILDCGGAGGRLGVFEQCGFNDVPETI